jgi:hypothetical protein
MGLTLEGEKGLLGQDQGRQILVVPGHPVALAGRAKLLHCLCEWPEEVTESSRAGVSPDEGATGHCT